MDQAGAPAEDHTEWMLGFETGWLEATLRHRGGVVMERIKFLPRDQVEKIARRNNRWLEWREPEEMGEWWAKATFGAEE
jgi:hypothetical protein